MSYTLPEPVMYGYSEEGYYTYEQMHAAFDAGRASRDAEVDKLKLKAELLKVALETSEGYLKQEREEVEALEKFRNEVINATGNKALADWIEKHGRPVPMQQEIDSLQAEVEALKDDLKHTEECCVGWASDYGSALKKIDSLAHQLNRQKQWKDAMRDKMVRLQAEVEALRAERDCAVAMLAEWCVDVDIGGSGWDYWDEHYKTAMYRPNPIRNLLDQAINAAREEK